MHCRDDPSRGKPSLTMEPDPPAGVGKTIKTTEKNRAGNDGIEKHCRGLPTTRRAALAVAIDDCRRSATTGR